MLLLVAQGGQGWGAIEGRNGLNLSCWNGQKQQRSPLVLRLHNVEREILIFRVSIQPLVGPGAIGI